MLVLSPFRACVWCLVLAIASGQAAAQQVAPSVAAPEAPALYPTEDPDAWQSEGTAVISLTGELALVDPDRSYRERLLGGGFSFQAVTKRTRWPVMVGFAAGLLQFDGGSAKGPFAGYLDEDGSFSLGSTTSSHSLQIRHAELLVRVEPFWGAIRPFVEGAVGFAAVWHAQELTSSTGVEIYVDEQQRDAAALYGVTVGFDIPLTSLAPQQPWATQLVLTVGARRLYTSPLERPVYAASEDQALSVRTPRLPLSFWQPFLGLGVSFDSTAETKRQRRARRAHGASP